MENYLWHWDVIIIIYLIGLMLSSMLYVPYCAVKYKTERTLLALTITSCFLWPICLPITIVWSFVKCLIIIPIAIVFKFLVRSLAINKTKLKSSKEIINLPEDERETIPFKLDPEFMNIVSERKMEK